jgi:hypothetical protein
MTEGAALGMTEGVKFGMANNTKKYHVCGIAGGQEMFYFCTGIYKEAKEQRKISCNTLAIIDYNKFFYRMFLIKM